MSHQYPFSGNPYAQSDPTTSQPSYSPYASAAAAPQSNPQHNNNSNSNSHGNQGYQDPYSDDYQDRYADPNGNHDNTLRNQRPENHHQYSSHDNDEKAPAVGTITSPYGHRGNSLDYSDRKGIWTREDKRAFQKRSVVAKIFRTLFCLVIVAVIFVISAFALVITFARPPNVGLANIEEPTSSDLKLSSGSFTFNLTVNIAVSNPNSISATLTHVQAKLYDATYPTIQIGNGNINDVKIEPNTNTTFAFPAQLKYSQADDPDKKIITDIANKCGLSLSSAGTRSDLDFKLNLDITTSILGLSIPISVKGISFSFQCPDVLGQIGSGLGSLLGGNSKREEIPGNDRDLLGERNPEDHLDLIPRSSLGDDGELVIHFARALESSLHQLARRNVPQAGLTHDSL